MSRVSSGLCATPSDRGSRPRPGGQLAYRSPYTAARLDFGTVRVNSRLVLAAEAPWGGFKGSGYGRDLSLYALDDYSRTEHVMHHHTR
ncbi:aldehyde dehydrogenase family protein [Streptomyces sp. NPDC056656]|uniref:aldehyde dehydrogenase family protein n=1 Tax=Streptomyces sp. NPDC056656 TaxID=3345895 RepID=UPI0036C589C6